MRLLKFTILAIFVAFSAACLLISGEDSKTKINSFTHHAQTLRKADAENIKGDFERENTFESASVKAQMSRSGADFFIEIEQNGTVAKYKIEAVVGTKTIQQYVARVDGKLVRLPVGFDLSEKRWTSLSETFFEADGADFSEYRKDWNANCAACHLEKDATETNFDAENLDSETALAACGSCHARGLHEHFPAFEDIAANKIAADDLLASHRIAAQSLPANFADGSPQIASREYPGIIRSVCFAQSKASGKSRIEGEKINCLSCHSIKETGEIAVERDKKTQSQQACTNCHRQFDSPEMIAEHTKHAPQTEASSCYSCHLPEIVYGHLRFQRTHDISVPNPELTITKNIPNACNACHLDKSVNWAISQTKNLWSERFLNAKTSTDAQFNEPEGIRGLIAGDAFIRAWTANNLRKNADAIWAKPFLLEALETENYPLVRYFLADSLERIDSPRLDFSQNSQNRFLPSGWQPRQKTKNIFEFLRKKRPSTDITIKE